MFDMFKNHKPDKNKIAAMLKTSPEALEAFEKAYEKQLLSEPISDNFFKVSTKQAAEMNAGVESVTKNTPVDLDVLIRRIVDELVAQTQVWKFDGTKPQKLSNMKALSEKAVTVEEIKSLPENVRPQLAGNLMKKDIREPSYEVLMTYYIGYINEHNPKKQKDCYNHFRQGLDILDLDPITYEIIGTNPNSMGYWLPKIADSVVEHGFFKIPKTTIIKVPLTLLQLTRCEYTELTRTTLDIVDKFCFEVFGLEEDKVSNSRKSMKDAVVSLGYRLCKYKESLT